MKRSFYLLFGMSLIAFSCTQAPPAEEAPPPTTVIGLNTPYYATPEFLNGKVKEVVEKTYLAVEQDGKYVKGERMSEEVRGKIGWTPSYIAQFDENGHLLKCTEIDEKDQVLTVNKQEVADGKLVKATYIWKDTVRITAHITCDQENNTVSYERRRQPVDTLMDVVTVTYDSTGYYDSWEFVNPAGEVYQTFDFTQSADGTTRTYKSIAKDGTVRVTRTEYYDEEGMPVKDVIVNSKGEEKSIEAKHTLSELGNWTSRVITGADTVVIEERTITYFEEGTE